MSIQLEDHLECVRQIYKDERIEIIVSTLKISDFFLYPPTTTSDLLLLLLQDVAFGKSWWLSPKKNYAY